MAPRPDVSEERKYQILNAAEEVFTRKGIDEARMEDIAEKTGLSKGTLYLYFKSKDDLILAILDRMFQREFRQLEILESEQSATDSLLNLTDLLIKEIHGLLRLIPIVYEFLALAFRNKYVRKVLKSYVNRYVDFLVPIIQSGIDSGEFRPVQAREAAIAVGAIFEGTLLLWVYDNSLVEPEYHLRSGMKLLLEGLQARAG